MKIIFLSHTTRDSLFKVGSYHLSKEFARMGHDILYVPSALSLFHFMNLPGLLDEGYRNSLKNRLASLKPVTDEDNVTNITPFVLIPFNKGVFDNPRIPVNQWFTFNRIDKKLEETGFNRADLVIQDKAGLYFMRKFIRAKTWIYRVTDDYSKMPRGAGQESIQELEQQICRYADQVLVTSRPLQLLFKERYGAEPTVLRNGVDAPHFAARFSIPEEYAAIDKPVILYVGSMDQRFDLNLLLETARRSPEWQYVLIGPGGKKIVPETLPNVTALGARPYHQIPAYMQHADVGILPLKRIEANHARSPMKIYEYGMCGLPVVSTPLRELVYRNEKFVTFAKNEAQFLEEIRHCLEDRENLAVVARQSSEKHSWNSIAHQVLKLAGVNSEEIA